MENSKHENVKELAKKIKKVLTIEIKCEIIIFYFVRLCVLCSSSKYIVENCNVQNFAMVL